MNKAEPKEGREVRYHDRRVVRLGDYVSTRIVFKRRRGRIVYLPGVSTSNPEFERDGLTWVAIHREDGWLVGSIVHPEHQTLQKKVRFVRRAGPEDSVAVLPDFPQGEDADED